MGVGALSPLTLLPVLERGVNQNSKPVCFSITGSPSATSLLFASHSLLTSEFSHFARFSNVLKRKIMTYSGFDRSEGLITFTPICPLNFIASWMMPSSHSSNSLTFAFLAFLVTITVTGASFLLSSLLLLLLLLLLF